MGFIGPDQPWTQATAGKEIAPTTKPCSEDWIKVRLRGEETLPPYVKRVKDENKNNLRCQDRMMPEWCYETVYFDQGNCFDTGRVIEATRPGRSRVKITCCAPLKLLPERYLTEPEHQEHGAHCQPFYHEGEEYPALPVWVDIRFPTPTGWAFRETSVISGGYKLVCKAIRGKVQHEFDPTMIMGQAQSTIAQAEEMLAERETRMAEREATIRAAEEEFEYGFFERYGVYMLAGAGIIGLGVTAGLIKRSMDKKKEAK